MKAAKTIDWTWGHTSEEIIAEFQKYIHRLDYKDTIEYVKKFVKAREIYSNDVTPEHSADMKSFYECIYSNLKAEATKCTITQEDFLHLVNICRD